MEDAVRNRLILEINKAYYVSKRYNTPSTFAVLYFEGDLPLSKLSTFVRVSDVILKVDDNRYFINFVSTEQSGAFKACQNLIVYLDKHLDNTKSRIALDTFDEFQTPTVVCKRLTQILTEIRHNPYNRIEDENILDDLF